METITENPAHSALADPHPTLPTDPHPTLPTDPHPTLPTKMNPEIKAAWVAALRSRKYKQGRRVLTNIAPNGETTHCCLGVLCEILPEIKATRTGDGYNETIKYGAGTERSAVYLPPDAVKAAGLDHNNPLVTLPNSYDGETAGHRLSELNDNYGWPFAKIADVIEAVL